METLIINSAVELKKIAVYNSDTLFRDKNNYDIPKR
jgi:hypothetical protein